MNPFDSTIFEFINGFAGRSPSWDTLIVFATENNLLKGGVTMTLFWWAWSRRDGSDIPKRNREYLLFGLGLCVFAVALARILALCLPFRQRPLHNPLIHFRLPYTMDPAHLESWSSFPSDHAVVFFSLAATLWMVSRRLGIFMILYVFAAICLPRIYTGIHYPTDILAGALIGWAVASLAKIESLRTIFTRPAFLWLEKRPGSFYAVLFLLTFELAELFDSVREMAHPVTHLIKPYLQHAH